jgi:hypothetical protein
VLSYRCKEAGREAGDFKKMTFRVRSTGKNPHWGAKGKIMMIGDMYLFVGLRHGWIEPTVVFQGNLTKKRQKFIDRQAKL